MKFKTFLLEKSDSNTSCEIYTTSFYNEHSLYLNFYDDNKHPKSYWKQFLKDMIGNEDLEDLAEINIGDEDGCQFAFTNISAEDYKTICNSVRKKYEVTFDSKHSKKVYEDIMDT